VNGYLGVIKCESKGIGIPNAGKSVK